MYKIDLAAAVLKKNGLLILGFLQELAELALFLHMFQLLRWQK